MAKIERFLPNNEYLAAILANSPSPANLFATINDLSLALPAGYEIICGIPRFSGGIWTLLDDATHTPIGISAIGVTSNAIDITFTKTYAEVASFAIREDAEYSKEGIRFSESSIGLNNVLIQGVADNQADKITWDSAANNLLISGFGSIPQSYIVWSDANSEIDITGDPNTLINIYSHFCEFFSDLLDVTIRTAGSNRVVFKIKDKATQLPIGDPDIFFGSPAVAEANFIAYPSISKPSRLDVTDAGIMNVTNSNIDFLAIMLNTP